MKRALTFLAGLALLAAGAPAAADAATSAAPPATSGTVLNGPVTWYGAADNDPAGSKAIAHPTAKLPGHGEAGGIGTFENPITFASEYKTTYPVGTRIYVPKFKKYFVMEDDCACNHGANHVDLWMEASGNSDVLACEDKQTPEGNVQIVKNPDSHRPVDTKRLC